MRSALGNEAGMLPSVRVEENDTNGRVEDIKFSSFFSQYNIADHPSVGDTKVVYSISILRKIQILLFFIFC